MKKVENFIDLTRTFLAYILWIAVFTSFVSGTFTQNIILLWLPLIVHQIIGWVGIIIGTLFAVAEIFGWKII